MKKILTLICAVALVAGAKVQAQQAKGTDMIPFQKAKAFNMASPLTMPAAKGVTKNAQDGDTIPCQSYDQAIELQSYIGYGATKLPYVTDPITGEITGYDWDMIGKIDAVFFTMGTGGLNYEYGGGEVGYSLDFQEGEWYDYMLGETISEKAIAGAMAYLGRAKSSVDSMNDKLMPLYFKHYSYPKGEVKLQKAYTDITSTDRFKRTANVRYPYDPTIGTLSEKVDIPITPDEKDPNEMGGDWFGARFTNPQLAGEWPCISVVFPTERNAEDSMWNVTMWYPFVGQDQIMITSEYKYAMYVVYDFDYQRIWYTDNTFTEYIRDREGFIPNEDDQPGTRYAIVPQGCFVYTDQNSNPTNRSRNGEPFMLFVVSDITSVERGAAYDKYVEVKKNPAIDYTVIASTDKIKNVEIYNMNGKMVKSQVCGSNMETISLQGLNSGMYIAKVTTEAGIANKKIMVR